MTEPEQPPTTPHELVEILVRIDRSASTFQCTKCGEFWTANGTIPTLAPDGCLNGE